MANLKTHVALHVADLHRSVSFYRAMLGTEPVKYKADYAKFDLDNPGLNLALNASDAMVRDRPFRAIETPGTLSHLGIQVDSREAVREAISRFQTAGLITFAEPDTDCCYALQDKVWVTDPDGNRWEIFVVTIADTTPDMNLTTSQDQRACCD
ncbi:Cadmium-induced protein CadI [Halomicronema hongdechloris C2206]|uniref:Cadmium-induced protein CadI n=1 Tax=Halomicronema hongdechloris C2206 TaxID=1641165 RepID=A0A1Z3HMD4_9CYAN|nr:ArsI/CadI family heavy metal resistance metalloenzyme [Halomicronema hongdechloris]ASC71460.1 Cadmium-induced protein CadI [Halomicronema hongdechloris C2206]